MISIMTRDFPPIVAHQPDVDVLMRYTRYPFSEGKKEQYTMIHIRVGFISNRDGKPHWEDYEVSEISFDRFDYHKVIPILINRLNNQ